MGLSDFKRFSVSGRGLVLGAALLGLGGALPAVAAAATVNVTTGTKYQVIQGFGASSYSESISNAEATSFFTDQSNAALGSQNGNSIGLSILRLSIDESGNFGTEGNDAKTSVGINPNLQVFASSWSPPAADKACNCVNGPGSGQGANTNTNFAPAGGSTNVPNNLPAFATYQAGFAQTMKNTYGVNLYAISPQNEPDWNTTYDSCLWTPQQFDTYVPLLRAALNSAGQTATKIMMPESFSDNLAGSNTTMADANAAPDVSIIGMHLYGGGPNAVPASYSTVAGHPIQGWVTEISEHSSSGTPFSDTMYYAQQIHKCIVDTGFNAYCYWWLVNLNSDDEGLYTSGAAPTSTYYMMGNWAKFIRPGYMRVSCTENPATNVQVSAYTGTATESGSAVNRVVIVAINSSGNSVSQAFNYTDQTVTQTYPWITSASQNFVAQAVQAVSGGTFTYTLPANSVTTFVSDCGSPGSPTPSPSRTPSFTASPSPTVTPTAIPTADACQSVIAVDCGSTTAYTSASLKLTFAADQQYVPGSAPGAAGSYGYVSWAAGTAYNNAGTITGGDAADAALYQYERYGTTLGYDFSVPNGQAYVTFYWADTYATAAGQRIFSVTLNGTTILNNLDLYVASGGQGVTYSRTFPVTVSNGVISVMMTASTQNATLEGISVQAGPPCSASSPTPSVTPTSTRTATASASPTASPSASASPTASASPSATRSASPTLTASVTTTRVNTATPTATGTDTPVSTATDTPVATRTPTPANTATLTPVNTATLTPMNSGSPTPAGTATLTPVKTASPSPVNTGTPSPAPSATSTPAGSATDTPASTLTVSPLATASPTAPSTALPSATPTPLVSGTASPSPVQTATLTPADSATATPTVTATASPTATASFTAMPTATSTASPTARPSGTATLSVTPTLTATPPAPVLQSLSVYSGPVAGGLTITVTGADFLPGSQVLVGTTSAQILSQSSTSLVLLLPVGAAGTVPVLVVNPDGQQSASLAFTYAGPKATATASPQPGGPLRIEQAWPQPNPDPDHLRLYVIGGADKVEVVVWSVALRRLVSADASPVGDGWVDVPLPPDFLTQAASGAYYFSARASRGSVETPRTLGRFYMLH